MGATANLANALKVLRSGMDSVVIRHYVAGIIGGRTLDVSGYNLPVIKAGHIVIRDTETDTYKPMPLNEKGDGYGIFPTKHEYVGVVVCTKPTSEPFVGIMYSGEVNDKAMPYSIDAADNGIRAELKKALPTLFFLHD